MEKRCVTSVTRFSFSGFWNTFLLIARYNETSYNKIMNTQDKQQRKHKRPWRRITAAVILLLVSAVLMILSARVPDFAEWYSEHIYPLAVNSIGRVSGTVPFSVSEIGIYILLILFVATLIRMIARMASGKGSKAGLFVSWISGVLLAAGILAFLYTVCCGINYHRRSFSEEEGIITYQYSADELKDICIWLTEEINSRADQVTRDEDRLLVLESSERDGAVEAMHRLSEEFPTLKGYYPQPKELLISEILSYQGLTGIYLPFTVEANYNGDMPAYDKPFTVCHELSHLRGFMEEQEANFIAFLACIGSERADFQYSGYLSGWVYCMNALYRADYESWQEVRGMLDEAAEPDLTANNEFWDRYEGTISETAERINDTYLKANGQADGVQSYNRMVDLIVAYFGDDI